jgi:hypothetical protein
MIALAALINTAINTSQMIVRPTRSLSQSIAREMRSSPCMVAPPTAADAPIGCRACPLRLPRKQVVRFYPRTQVEGRLENRK